MGQKSKRFGPGGRSSKIMFFCAQKEMVLEVRSPSKGTEEEFDCGTI